MRENGKGAGNLAESKFDRLDSSLAELVADAGDEHRFHLLQLEAEGGLGDAEDEVAAFDRDWLGVSGNEIAGELFPSGSDLIFVQSVFRSGGAQNRGHKLFGAVDTGVEIGGFIAAAPFPQDLFTDLTGVRSFAHRRAALRLRRPHRLPPPDNLPSPHGFGRVPRHFPVA